MLVKKLNVDRTENIIKMFEVIKVEMVSAIPSNELAAYFREIDAVKASLKNRVRLETGEKEE